MMMMIIIIIVIAVVVIIIIVVVVIVITKIACILLSSSSMAYQGVQLVRVSTRMCGEAQSPWFNSYCWLNNLDYSILVNTLRFGSLWRVKYFTMKGPLVIIDIYTIIIINIFHVPTSNLSFS